MKEESLLLLSDLQKLINQVVLIDYTIIILGGCHMKSLKKKAASVLASTAKKVVSANVNSCCMYVMYQPKLPAGAEKLKRN